jgi:hypothetical protein
METDVYAPHGYRDIYCRGCGHKLVIPIRCSSKLCRPCRFSRLFRIHPRIVLTLQKFKPTHGYSWKHITFTIPNTLYLEKAIKHLIASFRRLRQTKSWKKHVLGGFYVLEITNKGKGWHPHLHVICYSKYYPIATIWGRWRLSSKNGNHVYITQIWDNVGIAGYISKYLRKIPVLSPEDAIVYDDATRSTRMYNSFGSLHQLFGEAKIPKYKRPCEKCGCTSWAADFMLTIWKHRAVLDST